MTSDEIEPVLEEEIIGQRIRGILKVYPGISPTMLQAALGPQTSPSKWRPVLEEMINNKIVEQSVVTATTPSGRYNDYTKLTLKN